MSSAPGSARREVWTEGGAPAQPQPAASRRNAPLSGREPKELMDEVLALREANLQLKKRNAEQEEKTKQLATKMVRITSDMRRHGPVETPQDRAALRDATKQQQIDELRAELSQMEGKAERLTNQVTYYKQLAHPPAGRALNPSRRGQRKRLVTAGGASSKPADHARAHTPNATARSAATSGAEDIAHQPPPTAPAAPPVHVSEYERRDTPPSRPHSRPQTPRSSAPSPRRRSANAPVEDPTSVARLLELLEAKERQIEGLRARAGAALSPPRAPDVPDDRIASAVVAAAVEPGSVPAETIAAAVRAGLEEHRAEQLQAAVGAHESATVVELRRLVRERGAQHALAQQKLDGLAARFEALRENNDKAVSQLQELNRLLHEERMKSSRLEQDATLRQMRADEVDELRTQLEAARQAKRIADDEKAQLLERALSDADSSELGALRRELADKTRAITRLQQAAKAAEESTQDAQEKTRAQEVAAANLRAELGVVSRTKERLGTELESQRALTARLQEQLALYTGDAGVAPEELMRALALVREGGGAPAGGAGRSAYGAAGPAAAASGAASRVAGPAAGGSAARAAPGVVGAAADPLAALVAAPGAPSAQAASCGTAAASAPPGSFAAPAPTPPGAPPGAHGAARSQPAEMLSADEDTLLRSLPAPQRRHVQGVLVQNSELILALQKSEHLLQLAQGMNAALQDELGAARLEHDEAMATRARQLDSKEAEISQLRKELVMRPGGAAAAAAASADADAVATGGALARRGAPGRFARPRGHEGESSVAAPSLISEGETSELNVRDDENLFELHVLSAELHKPYFPGAAPRTFVTVDFYQHETQATPLVDGHAPIYDLLAQFIVVADDLLLHYLRTRELVLEVRQARATDEALVATARVPLASLLSPAFVRSDSAGIVGGGSGGRVKHAIELVSADGFGHAVGTLRFTMRMRRPMDHVLVPFYRRFPELTTPPTAVVPRQLSVRVVGCRGLRAPAALGGAAPTAPYAFYCFYEFGDYETPTGRGADPVFDSAHAFVVDVRSRRLRDELRRSPLRISVLDDDDSTRASDEPLGHADVDLSTLVVDERPLPREYPLHDDNGLPVGTLLLDVTLGPVPSAALPSVQQYDDDAGVESAAVLIQSRARGRQARRTTSAQLGSRALRVRVGTLELSAKSLSDERTRVVWVEADVLGLGGGAAGALRTATRDKGGARIDFGFAHELALPEGSEAERTVRSALVAEDEEEADVYFTVLGAADAGGAGGHQLGSAHLNLQEILRAGLEASRVTLQLSDGAGRLSVSLTGLSTLQRLQREAGGGQPGAVQPPGSLQQPPYRAATPAGRAATPPPPSAPAAAPADALEIRVGALTLEPSVQRDAAVQGVGVEVELLDLDDTTALKTPMLPKGDGRSPLDFKFSRAVAVEQGSARERLLYDALASDDKQDSDVVFFLFAHGRGGERTQIGEASLNLEKMLEARREQRDVSLKVVSTPDGKRQLGTLSASVLGLATLQRVDELPEPPPRASTAAPSTADRAAADASRPTPAGASSAAASSGSGSLEIRVGTLALEPSVQRDAAVQGVGVEVELLDLDDTTALKTPMLPKGDGRSPLDFKFSRAVAVEQGSARERLLYDALASDDKQDSDVVFFLFAHGRGGERTQIGEASLNLEKMLEARREQRDVSLKVVSTPDGKRQLGTLSASVLGLATLQRVDELPEPPPRASTASAVTPAPGTSADARSDVITVRVGALALEPSVQRDAAVQGVGVEVELLDLDDATALKTPMLPKGDGRSSLDFKFERELRVHAGSSREQLLRTALASSDPQDSDVVFFLFAQGRSGERTQIGEASLNLEKILEARREQRDVSLKVVSTPDGKRQLGTLTASVLGLATLQRVRALPAPSSTPPAPAAAPDETLSIQVDSLRVEPGLLRDAAVENLGVEVELLDLDDATALKTDVLPKGDGSKPLAFGFQAQLPVTKGSLRERQLREMLATKQTQDTDVVFFLFASGRGGHDRRQVGEASVNLEKMLAGKREQRQVALEVVSTPDGDRRLGTLTVSVLGLATLQRVAALPAPSASRPVTGATAGAR